MNKIVDKEDILFLRPVTQYTPPEYPTNVDANSNPALLKKLPSRWQKSAAAAACVGLVGSVVLTGCPWILPPHGGGSGGAPVYVVHLTEQEALAIIRSQLETAGLDFNATPPVHIVDVDWFGTIGLDLYDKDKDVAIAIMAQRQPDENCGGYYYTKDGLEEAFSILAPDLTVGVFYCPGEYYDGWQPSTEQEEKMKKTLEAHLSGQIREFIQLLQAKGILDSAS